MMFTAVAWYYRLGAIILLSMTLFGYGWLKGAAHVQAEYDKFKSGVEAIGKIQQAKNKTIATQSAKVSANIEKNYVKNRANIRRIYGPGRVQHDTSGSTLPVISETASGANERPADAGFSPGIKPPAANGCDRLTSDAAATTVQYLALRAWVERQERTFSDSSAGSPASGEL